MRLISLTVRNYRIHREVTIEFDRSRNLIGGDNESGKSTLVEAAHRGLFLRAKTGGTIQTEMISRHLGVDPEVVIVFETAAGQWEIEKRFAGTRGSTRLSGPGISTLKDDEADAKLSEVLSIESGVRANRLADSWPHLWVWQGSSGEDPAQHANANKDTLIQRLQKDGVSAVMESSQDQTVREKIASRFAELFTTTGRPKSGAPADLAKKEAALRREELTRAETVAARLEDAVVAHAEAQRDLQTIETTLPALRDQRNTVEQKLKQVAELQEEEQRRLKQYEAASLNRQQLAKHHATIGELHEKATLARESLQPKETQEAQFVSREQESDDATKTADLFARKAGESVRLARMHHDLAAARIEEFEKSATHQRLVTQWTEAKQVQTERNDLRKQLSELPLLSADELKSLRNLERQSSQAASKLAAIATGIELLETAVTVTLDGSPLAVGDSKILSETTELAMGDGTRLRIRPGGGSSLATAREEAETSRTAWRDALAKHALQDLGHAETVFEQRQAVQHKLAQQEARWSALKGDTLEDELAAAELALTSARSELTRRREALGDHAPSQSPNSLADARDQLTAARDKLATAESHETTVQQRATETRQRAESAAKQLQAFRADLSEARQTLRDLETELKVLENAHGNAETRRAALDQSITDERESERQLAETRKVLAALSPESLKSDLERLTRAVDQQESRKRDAESAILINRDRLASDGSSDPDAELRHAKARLQAAEELVKSEERRAAAIETLHRLFSSSRESINRALVQPLADRISDYLKCCFGPNTSARVQLSDSGVQDLELVREGDSSFSFAALSGGAKEQTAAAVRLALAEILAADHDGCLPVVFDDAFAYSDDDRIQSLQRMLELAANRGLQIILLSCAPAKYAALGAVEHRLSTHASCDRSSTGEVSTEGQGTL